MLAEHSSFVFSFFLTGSFTKAIENQSALLFIHYWKGEKIDDLYIS